MRHGNHGHDRIAAHFPCGQHNGAWPVLYAFLLVAPQVRIRDNQTKFRDRERHTHGLFQLGVEMVVTRLHSSARNLRHLLVRQILHPDYFA
jgi:hypothetical protein